MSIPNLPPADELAALREQIKQLQTRENELRELMLVDPAARSGNHFVVSIKEYHTARLDTKELSKNYPEIAEQFTFQLTQKSVVLHAITEDGEIMPIKSNKEKNRDRYRQYIESKQGA